MGAKLKEIVDRYNTIVELQNLPKEGEVLVLKTPNETTRSEMEQMAKQISGVLKEASEEDSTISDNVLVMPSDHHLQSMSREELEEIRDSINNFLRPINPHEETVRRDETASLDESEQQSEESIIETYRAMFSTLRSG